jgi:hypothetical protein
MSPTITKLGVRALVAALAVTSLVACGSDKDSSDAVTTLAPEDVMVSDAVVSKGLANTVAKMTALAADPSHAGDADAVEDLWASYEGTVKSKEAALYLDFEDALGKYRDAAKKADGSTMRTALASFIKTSADYLTKHPG